MILNEEEANLPLFEYIETTLLWFDTIENTSIFHHQFLMGLTKFLGFNPDIQNSELPFFNLQEGKFQAHLQEYCITNKNLDLLKPFLGTKFDINLSIELSSVQKHELLNMILVYYKLHLQSFRTPKSLTVLSQVYS